MQVQNMSYAEIMNKAIVESDKSRQRVAAFIGYSSVSPLNRILNENDENYFLPAERIPAFCAATDSTALIEAIAQDCGGHFVIDAKSQGGVDDLMEAIGDLAGQFGKTLQMLIKDASDDGVLSRAETKRNLQKVKKAITELLAGMK